MDGEKMRRFVDPDVVEVLEHRILDRVYSQWPEDATPTRARAVFVAEEVAPGAGVTCYVARLVAGNMDLPGRRKMPSISHQWSSEDDGMLRRLFALRLTDAQIARKLRRSEQGVRRRRHRLGLSRSQ